MPRTKTSRATDHKQARKALRRVTGEDETMSDDLLECMNKHDCIYCEYYPIINDDMAVCQDCRHLPRECKFTLKEKMN